MRGSQSWWSYVRHAKTAELPVVLLEDLAALIGLILALAGVGLVLITGSPVYEAISTIAIGALLAGVAVVLAIEMKSLLMANRPQPPISMRSRARSGARNHAGHPSEDRSPRA